MERAGRRGRFREHGSLHLHLPVVYTRQPQAGVGQAGLLQGAAAARRHCVMHHVMHHAMQGAAAARRHTGYALCNAYVMHHVMHHVKHHVMHHAMQGAAAARLHAGYALCHAPCKAPCNALCNARCRCGATARHAPSGSSTSTSTETRARAHPCQTRARSRVWPGTLRPGQRGPAEVGRRLVCRGLLRASPLALWKLFRRGFCRPLAGLALYPAAV